jgi:hypothetical protein
MCAISSARRLSNAATRKPANDDESTVKAAPIQLLTDIEYAMLGISHAKALSRKGNHHKEHNEHEELANKLNFLPSSLCTSCN